MRNKIVCLLVIMIALMMVGCNRAVNQDPATATVGTSESLIASPEGTPKESSSAGTTEPEQTNEVTVPGTTDSGDLKNTEQTSSQPISSAAPSAAVTTTSVPATSTATKSNVAVTATAKSTTAKSTITKPTATTKPTIKPTVKPTVKPTATPTVKPTQAVNSEYEVMGQDFLTEVLKGLNERRKQAGVAEVSLDKALNDFCLNQAWIMAKAGKTIHSEDPIGPEGVARVPAHFPAELLGDVMCTHVPNFLDEIVTKAGVAVVKRGSYLYAIVVTD